jgi:hypothetical protein
MFRELRVGNFKGFSGSHTISLGKINLFYGANSAGKSALLESLLLMRQSIRSRSINQDQGMEPFLFNGAQVDLGSFQATINGHNFSKKLVLGGSYENELLLGDGEKHVDVHHFDVEVAWDHETKSQVLEGCTYRVDSAPENTITFKRVKSGAGEAAVRPEVKFGFSNVSKMVLETTARRLPSVNDMDSSLSEKVMLNAAYENWSFLPGIAAPEEKPRMIKKRIEIEKLNDGPKIIEKLESEIAVKETVIKDLVEEMMTATWREMLVNRFRDTSGSFSRIRYLGPLRKSPTRIERLVEKSKTYVGREGEGVASILHRDPSTVVTVNRYMREMSIPYELHVRKLDPDGAGTLGEIIALQLVDLRSNVILSLEDVGFGISQVLPLLVQMAISKKDMVLIEQPELHLHPAIQAHFGDLLIEGSQEEKRNQFIIETHSEHLLLRLQRRIREGILPSEDVRIYYIDANSELGSYAQLIELDENGEFITPWPNGFFPERLDEMLA